MENKDVTFEKAFASLLAKEKYHDVTLRGNDGVTVPANRSALASRCEFFEKLFFSDFKEAQSKTVEIGFPGAVLEATVEYLHTNKVAMLATPTAFDPLNAMLQLSNSILIHGLATQPKTTDFSKFPKILSLTDAAAYFDLPGLHQLTLKSIRRYLKSRPQFALVILQESQEKRISAEIEKMALAKIQTNIKECLHSTAIKDLDLLAVKKILQDSGIMSSLTAAQVFQLIQVWSDYQASDKATSAAKELIAKYVHLADIPPSQLSTIVESSGLVTNEQITATYKMQAFKLEELHGFAGSSLLQWKGSKSKIFTLESQGYNSDCLDCKPNKSGKHQRTIDVKNDTNAFIFLGIASPTGFSSTLQSNYRGMGVWVYHGTGHAHNQNQETTTKRVKFGQGSRVSLTLNLCPTDVNNGSLSISVDGESPRTNITNLRNHIGDGGFMPVVTMYFRGDSVELVNKTELV